jgi:hypothetical protein
MGISEHDFWSMTFAELDRALSSKRRVAKEEQKEKALYDYVLADLIGRSVGRIYSSSAKMPDIASVYPGLFNEAEIEAQKAEKQAQLSILRFKQFADSYNKRFYGGANKT